MGCARATATRKMSHISGHRKEDAGGETKSNASILGFPTYTLANRYQVRYATLKDASEMERIERAAFGSLAPGMNYSHELKRDHYQYLLAVRNLSAEELLARNKRRRNGFSRFGRRMASLMPHPSRTEAPDRTDEIVAGMIGTVTAADQAHVMVVAVRPDERKRGAGELLLIAALIESQRKGARNASLEVRKSNSTARALYKKYGFADTGIRHRYYADNNEDAIIMSTPLITDGNFTQLLKQRIAAYRTRWRASNLMVTA